MRRVLGRAGTLQPPQPLPKAAAAAAPVFSSVLYLPLDATGQLTAHRSDELTLGTLLRPLL
jgi:hypothetical protein